MPSNLELTHDLYSAFARADAERLLQLLHPEFVGYVTEGMPDGIGGTHTGPTAMLTEVWAPVARRFAVRPLPDRFYTCDDGDVVVIGSYVGEPPGTDRPFTAAFAHVLAFRDGLIAELRQVTDSQGWGEAAASADVAVIRRMFEAVEHRNAEALLSTYAEDVVITEASSLPYGGVYRGHEGALRHGMAYLATWDSIQTTDDRKLQPLIRNAGDRVIVVWRQKATSADGRRLDLPVIDLIELRDGQVESLEMYHLDTAAVLEFLGTTSAAAA
jgi:ketosteroid isomerase-like protein